MYQNNILVINKGRIQKFLTRLAVLFLGVLALCLMSAPRVFAKDNIVTVSSIFTRSGWPGLSTAHHGGDTVETFHSDLLPMVKLLAAGKIPGDKLTWTFEDAILYTEDSCSQHGAEFSFCNCGANNFLENPKHLVDYANETNVGLFDLRELGYTIETRKIERANGETVYRCALTGLYVTKWQTPSEAACSREEALKYYNECQKQISVVVSKVIAARQPNGNPLTNEQKLKWIHDWLATSVEYDSEGLDAFYSKTEGWYSKYGHLWNEYGPIIRGMSVCQGYAHAYKAIIDELNKRTGTNIECEVAIGGDHAWNRVKLDGQWYHVDVTWDDSEDNSLVRPMDTTYFLVSDYALSKHPGKDGYITRTSALEKATSRKYEGKEWPRYQKDLSEYTVILNEPDKIYIYNSSEIVPAVTLKYGDNMLSPDAYQVKKIGKAKTGVIKTRIVPSDDCVGLSGSISGPEIVVAKAKIDGVAKTTKKYKFNKKISSVRPFDKTFKPFDSANKYSQKTTSAKVKKSLTLKCGKDYTVKYKNNIKPGWATATIMLKGDYAGKITVKYKIDKFKVSGTAKSTKNYKLGKSKSIRPFDKTFKPFATIYKYTKQPELAKVLKKSLTLKKGTDYTVTYKNNKKKGWATATIILKGNYSGKIIIKYEIVK